MKMRWFSVFAVFMLILGLHFGINSWKYSHIINKWAEIENHGVSLNKYNTIEDYLKKNS